jgi:hypothetical protein
MRIHNRWIPDKDHPKATGQCDYSGFVVPYSELVKQMEYRGNALVWTGFLVWNRFADKPNPQLLDPILPPDPVPLKNPRPVFVGDNTQVNLINQTLAASTIRLGEGYDQEFTN